MAGTTLALVGATGGAGTTRFAVECAGTLARMGWDVAVIDAAYETQGLRRYVDHQPVPDITAICTDGGDLEDALQPLGLDVPGRVTVAPASAPFERVARAKTAEAARALEQQVAAAALGHDAVLVDTPPVAANQAVAAATCTDRVAVVAPDSPRGRDGLALTRGRLEDLGAGLGAVVATGVGSEPGQGLGTPDARIPALDGGPAAAPTTVDPGATGAEAVAAALGPALGVEVEAPDGGGGLGRIIPGR